MFHPPSNFDRALPHVILSIFAPFAGDLGCVAQVRGKDEMQAQAGLYSVKLSLSDSATTFCDMRADGESPGLGLCVVLWHRGAPLAFPACVSRWNAIFAPLRPPGASAQVPTP